MAWFSSKEKVVPQTPPVPTISNELPKGSLAELLKSKVKDTTPTVVEEIKPGIQSTRAGWDLSHLGPSAKQNEVIITPTPEVVTPIPVEMVPADLPVGNVDASNPEVNEVTQEANESKDESVVFERKFLLTFLKEIHDIVEKGKEIEEMMEARQIGAQEFKKESSENSQILGSAKDIEASLEAFTNAVSENDLQEKFQAALESVITGIELISKKIDTAEKDGRTKDNNYLTKISAKKAEINTILKLIGNEKIKGQINFEQIRDNVKRAERIAKIAKQQERVGNVKASRIESVNKTVVEAISEDLPKIKQILENKSESMDHRLLSLLMLLYSKENNN
jgi:hypothetical protein